MPHATWVPLPKICCPWGSDTLQTGLVGTGDRPGGCPADPVGASLADGVCLALPLDAASKVTEQEWREKAKKDLEEWNLRQNEQMEKNRANNRYARVSVATRAATGAAVQPDLPAWDAWGPLSPPWCPALQGWSFARQGEMPQGCEWLRWLRRATRAGTILGSQWDLGASCPLRGPRVGAGLGHCLHSPAVTGRFSWCHVCCDELVALCGRTLTPCFSLPNPLPACLLCSLCLCLGG